MTTTAQHRYRLHPQAAHRKVAGEVFVVTGDRAFHRLQATTAVDLFDALAQSAAGVSAQELSALLVQKYAVGEAEAQRDVAEFLATVQARQLAVSAADSGFFGPDSPQAVAQAKVTP